MTQSSSSCDSACVGCPARKRGVLAELLGEGKATCAFRGVRIPERGPLPASLLAGHACVLVRRGAVLLERSRVGGQPVAVDVACVGAMARIDARGRAGYALSETLLCALSREKLDAAVERGGATALQLFDLFCEASRRMEHIAWARGAPTAKSRVALLLAVLSRGPNATIPHGLRQRDLGHLLGMRPETVCRALRALEASGAVASSAEGLTVLDRDALQRLS